MQHISNESLKLFLETRFNKPFEQIDDHDKLSLEQITFIAENPNEKLDFKVLQEFPNLKSIVIKKTAISNNDIEEILKLQKVDSISFSNCVFQDENILKKLSYLKFIEFYNCYIEDYTFLNEFLNLESLIIEKPYDETDFDLGILKKCTKLKNLTLDMMVLVNFSEIINLQELEYLSLLKSNIDIDIPLINSSLKSLNRLQKLYISERYITDELEIGNSFVVRNNLFDEVTFDDEIDTRHI